MTKCAWIALLILPLLLVGCASQRTTKTVTHYYTYMPLSEDLKQITDHLTKTNPDAETWNYAARIIDRRDIMNAEVHPQSKGIYFTSGLVRQVPRDELRCVMAHEVGHIELGHYGKRVAVDATTRVGMTVLNKLIPGAGLASWVVNPAINKGFSRSQEVDADVYSVQLVKEVWNINPESCIVLLMKLRAEAERKGESNADTTGIYDSHPNLQYRIEKIKEYAKEKNL